jgi:signal peptidase I
MTAITPQEDYQQTYKRAKNRESLLETLESIVVAFVLAFVFRAFVVEAFVIPTGSMGPTLYGAHYELTCMNCGLEFAVSADARPDSRSPLENTPICPNCFHLQTEAFADQEVKIPEFSGDRILVLKFIYDFEEPRRWDVIVFRNPNDPSQNFIKRLVALPGEQVQIVHGDVWINNKIAHKTDKAQEALWQIVHDTRYRPTERDWQPRWIADAEWAARDTGFVTEKSADAAKTAWLTYRHRDSYGQPDNIKDFCAYNTGSRGRAPSAFGTNIVTDLSLKASVTATDPKSIVIIEMRAWSDRFRFELSARGGDQPSRIFVNGQVVSESDGGVLPPGRPTTVQAANVDHKLMLLVGGRRVTTTRLPATPEGDVMYEPTSPPTQDRFQFEETADGYPTDMATEVRLGARGPAEVGWLRLDRDVYYTSDYLDRTDGNAPAAIGKPYALMEDEFFVLGDNSPRSFDARVWPLERSAVPRKNLVGKAFFVYWPAAGTRHHMPLAPDPTEFRLVH